MISFQKCLDITNVVRDCANMKTFFGSTGIGDYTMTLSNNFEGNIRYKDKFLISFFISSEFYHSIMAILPSTDDPWNAVPYFEITLREGRGTDVIPVLRRYDNIVLDINVLEDEVTTDSDIFDGVCFQNSLVLESCDLYAIMLEPFIRNLKIRGSQFRFYERLFEDETHMEMIKSLIKQRNTYGFY